MTYNQFNIMMEQAKREVNSEYKKELLDIRSEAYELNKEVGFYGIDGMTYREFLEAMKGYSFEERMKISFALLHHIAALDNIIFDNRRREE